MPTEIVVETRDRPGGIAEIGELFGNARVNIKAAAAFAHGGQGYLHFVVDNADRALAALKVGGWKVSQAREGGTVIRRSGDHVRVAPTSLEACHVFPAS